MDKTGIEAGLFAKLIIIKGLKGLRRLGNTMRKGFRADPIGRILL